MRLYEFASAEEQLALWKLVSDSVWQSLATQAKQAADEQAAKQQASKLKPKKPLKAKIGRPVSIPLPKLPPPKPAQPQNVAPKPAVAPVSQVNKFSEIQPKIGGLAAKQVATTQPPAVGRQA